MTNRNCVHIWTDGSYRYSTEKGGWAAILYDPSTRMRREISGSVVGKYPSPPTNNRMELTAAIKALKELKEPCNVVLTSDSEYLVMSMKHNRVQRWMDKGWQNGYGIPTPNVDLWQQLLGLSGIHNIEWVWVRGHNNHPENSRCDYLAQEASR